VRLLLDVHISGPVVGGTLRERGHEVLAADQSAVLRELEDAELFRLAKREGRVLVTANVGDFMEQATEWAHVGESHAGLVLISYQVDRSRFGFLIRSIAQLFEGCSQGQWTDRVSWLGFR
jgi:predicted nuclease of predicted toxin-antitoxin system